MIYRRVLKNPLLSSTDNVTYMLFSITEGNVVYFGWITTRLNEATGETEINVAVFSLKEIGAQNRILINNLEENNSGPAPVPAPAPAHFFIEAVPPADENEERTEYGREFDTPATIAVAGAAGNTRLNGTCPGPSKKGKWQRVLQNLRNLFKKKGKRADGVPAVGRPKNLCLGCCCFGRSGEDEIQ